jgi:CheY-like chemotaxis protein
MVSQPTAIAIAPHGASPALGALIERLREGEMHVTLTDELGSAASLAVQTPEAPPCILLDFQGAFDEIEDRRHAATTILRTATAIPHVLPIAVTSQADPQLIVACLRAGAGDVLDLHLEGTANASALLARVWHRQRAAARTATLADRLRAMVEDLLKDLIKTERRSIALEEQLNSPGAAETREPAVLIVERDLPVADALADQLEAAGVTSYAYATGDDATRDATRLAVDLAVVAAQLPGIDGLETIRRLRLHAPGLPAFLLTSVPDPDLAARAADLGVVGFVQKPLANLPEAVARLAQLARASLLRSREHAYLERIKERHERVLVGYRALPRDA